MSRGHLMVVAAFACGVVACRVAASAADRQMVDAIGRHVRIPSAPHRVVALAPSITETVYSLGAGADVAGVTDFTDWPPEARNRPRVGGIVNPSIEKQVALRPDLVISTREANHRETIDELDRLAFPCSIRRVRRHP